MLSCFGLEITKKSKKPAVPSTPVVKRTYKIKKTYNFDPDQKIRESPLARLKRSKSIHHGSPSQAIKIEPANSQASYQEVLQERIHHMKTRQRLYKLEKKCGELKRANKKWEDWSKTLERDVVYLVNHLERLGHKPSQGLDISYSMMKRTVSGISNSSSSSSGYGTNSKIIGQI